MKLIDVLVKCKSRSEQHHIYPIYDTHIGSRACAETPLKQHVSNIKKDPYAHVLLGGDIADCVIPSDLKRFNFNILPDWMLEGDATETRDMLIDMLNKQIRRVESIFAPIKEKIDGGLEGNHEFQISKRHSINVMGAFFRGFGLIDLTDEALVRYRFKSNSVTSALVIYLRHGYGGGRTAGAEPNKLARMMNEWEIADICISGHTHTCDTIPPKPVLTIPRSKGLPKETFVRYRYACNPGCWTYSHPVGPSSYASRACYPARPMVTYRIDIKPFSTKQKDYYEMLIPHIELRQITMS